MLKKDKLHLILRAKHGSQILKYQNPSGPLTSSLIMPAGNPFMTSDGIPTAQLSSIDTGNINTLNFSDPLYGVDTRSGIKRFMDKNKNTFKQVGQIAGQVGMDVANGLINQGRANQINSSGVDAAFGVADTVGNVAGKINPVLGAAVKGVTTIFKGIDTLFGSKSKEFGVKQSTLSQVGGSYGGATANITDAASKANKKYGLFSSGARRKANKLIDKATSQQNIMTDIAQQALDQRSMVNDLTYNQNQMDLNGGYNQKYIRAAKHGTKLQDKIDFVIARRLQSRINVNTKQVEEFKNGGQIEWIPEIILDVESFKEGGQIEWKPEIIWEPEIQEFKEGDKTEELEQTPKVQTKKLDFNTWFNSIPKHYRANGYDYKKAYEVFDWDLLSKHAKDPNQYHLYSVSPTPDENGNYPFLKLGKLNENPELKEEFDWYNSEAGKNHKAKFDIQYIGDRYYYVPKKFKEGGKIDELETPEIEETNQKNIIPEGALHKNKHHMEHAEGLTQKGIPVVDNEGEQQAEIELDEIIFTLEVTKKLEELYKDGSDKAAIEAGKLLVKEILFNTDDRTGLIAKCEKGGKLNDVE